MSEGIKTQFAFLIIRPVAVNAKFCHETPGLRLKRDRGGSVLSGDIGCQCHQKKCNRQRGIKQLT